MPKGIYNIKNRGKWNVGKHHSEETKEKMSKSHLGKTLSPEHISKIVKNLIPGLRKGVKLSKETRIKMSQSAKGRRLSKLTCKKISEATKKESNPNWKGGISTESQLIRGSIEYKLWKGSVFIRDNFTCRKCKTENKGLIAHHLFNFAEYLELRFAIDNGITLCINCHHKFHTIYGWKNNNKQQMQEFLFK